MTQDAPQRMLALHELFHALRWLVRTGSRWRYVPRDLPPWHTVYVQTQGSLVAGCFGSNLYDLRHLLRIALGRNEESAAIVLDGDTLQGTIESGNRAGCDAHNEKRGSKVHVVVATLGHLLVALAAPTNEQERTPVGELVKAVQKATDQHV